MKMNEYGGLRETILTARVDVGAAGDISGGHDSKSKGSGSMVMATKRRCDAHSLHRSYLYGSHRDYGLRWKSDIVAPNFR